MDRVFQIFVSSTFADLQEERHLVSNSLAKAGYVPAGMELFPATDQDQFEYIKRIIDRSDYYVVITAGRYGSVAGDGIGFTEKEFDYARSKGIPVLAFLHRNVGSLPIDKSEREETGRTKLKSFNDKLKQGRMIDFWENEHELCTKVVIAVSQAVNLSPGTGWVRGDNAIDPKILQEAEKLRIENAELKQKLANLQGTLVVEFDPLLAGPDTEITLDLTTTISNYPSHGHRTESREEHTTFKNIFLAIYDGLLHEPSQATIAQVIGKAFSPSSVGGMTMTTCSDENSLMIRRQLEALGLIVTASKMSSTGHDYLAWVVTEKGRKYSSLHSALRPIERPD
ncbi:DUF4062 domain-containing protein [Bradyrhizobium sp. LCT2]|uniref:DUF4062 domain-containing protein n=1 Tax=Bradyrhizobium sp. LCT2 TaxID=2493093 RepID=UPI001374FA1D|nr:DUF4062 domain-containing protein [Bradyrhizobium sp. LCT2]